MADLNKISTTLINKISSDGLHEHFHAEGAYTPPYREQPTLDMKATLEANDINIEIIDVYSLWSAWSVYNDASWLIPSSDTEILDVVKKYLDGTLKLK